MGVFGWVVTRYKNVYAYYNCLLAWCLLGVLVVCVCGCLVFVVLSVACFVRYVLGCFGILNCVGFWVLVYDVFVVSFGLLVGCWGLGWLGRFVVCVSLWLVGFVYIDMYLFYLC